MLFQSASSHYTYDDDNFPSYTTTQASSSYITDNNRYKHYTPTKQYSREVCLIFSVPLLSAGVGCLGVVINCLNFNSLLHWWWLGLDIIMHVIFLMKSRWEICVYRQKCWGYGIETLLCFNLSCCGRCLFFV